MLGTDRAALADIKGRFAPELDTRTIQTAPGPLENRNCIRAVAAAIITGNPLRIRGPI
jgi:hypothetical protein